MLPGRICRAKELAYLGYCARANRFEVRGLYHPAFLDFCEALGYFETIT